MGWEDQEKQGRRFPPSSSERRVQSSKNQKASATSFWMDQGESFPGAGRWPWQAWNLRQGDGSLKEPGFIASGETPLPTYC